MCLEIDVKIYDVTSFFYFGLELKEFFGKVLVRRKY